MSTHMPTRKHCLFELRPKSEHPAFSELGNVWLAQKRVQLPVRPRLSRKEPAGSNGNAQCAPRATRRWTRRPIHLSRRPGRGVLPVMDGPIIRLALFRRKPSSTTRALAAPCGALGQKRAGCCHPSWEEQRCGCCPFSSTRVLLQRSAPFFPVASLSRPAHKSVR